MVTRFIDGWRGRLVSASFAAIYGLGGTACASDDNRWMFRFETSFGGKQSHQRLDFVAGVTGDWVSVEHPDGRYPFRVPLYTSAPSEWAVFRTGNDETPDGYSPTSAGEALGAVVGLVIYFGLPLYALVKGIDEAGDRAAEEALRDFELPPPPEIPDDLIVATQS